MIAIRYAGDRGHFDYGWLDTHHTFSFGGYHDPQHTQFRALRVMNEDRVSPGAGFGEHPHRDMEIITYVLSGALEHKDSLGNGEVLRPGELQRMSAGTGVVHSEFNPSGSEPSHFYQVWLLPNQLGVAPSYEQKSIPADQRRNRLRLAASSDGREGSLSINQHARVYLATLDAGVRVEHHLEESRGAWLQVLRGGVALDGRRLVAGDGAAVSEEKLLEITADQHAEVMLFDLA